MTRHARSFPAPWTSEEADGCFIIRDHNGQALTYVYFENEKNKRAAFKQLTRDEARRIAANIVSRGLGRIERAILEVIEGEAACQRALRSERLGPLDLSTENTARQPGGAYFSQIFGGTGGTTRELS